MSSVFHGAHGWGVVCAIDCAPQAKLKKQADDHAKALGTAQANVARLEGLLAAKDKCVALQRCGGMLR
jgi:hypothetical protein